MYLNLFGEEPSYLASSGPAMCDTLRQFSFTNYCNQLLRNLLIIFSLNPLASTSHAHSLSYLATCCCSTLCFPTPSKYSFNEVSNIRFPRSILLTLLTSLSLLTYPILPISLYLLIRFLWFFCFLSCRSLFTLH